MHEPSDWIEVQLSLIERDRPWPTVHARNLFHVSAGMHDAWAAFHPAVDGVLVNTSTELPADEHLVRIAIGHAALEILKQRYARTNRDGLALLKFERKLRDAGLRDPLTGDAQRAARLGRDVARAILQQTRDDGSNEAADYDDDSGYRPRNSALDRSARGASLVDPDRWQPIIVEGRTQEFVTPHWRQVRPFALPERDLKRPYLDPGPPPLLNSGDHAELAAALVELIRASSRLDGLARDAEARRMADRGRVSAEYWEDGPGTETPVGHWNLIALAVAERVPVATTGGSTEGRLAWELGLFVALNAALHDSAIACWDIKRHYDSVRPISLIRHMAGLGQSSDPDAAHYHPLGLPLVPGLIELVTEQSAATGARHAHLGEHIGKLAVRCWRGNPEHPNTQIAGVGWQLAVEWLPYQHDEFVTPAFGGYVSGHSTFSSSAAAVLAWYLDGDEIPGGPIKFTAPAKQYLRFERGPSRDVVLSWSTFSEMANDAGRSRIWGGIHPSFDDTRGREVGARVAELTIRKLSNHNRAWRGTADAGAKAVRDGEPAANAGR